MMQLLSEGNTNQAVANSLRMSIHTVQDLRRKIMKKLNLQNGSDMLRFAPPNATAPQTGGDRGK